MRPIRAAAAVAPALVASALAAAAAAAPAEATAYRYWTYWSGSDQAWTFSAVGPASSVPPDGAVEGWRFAVSTGTRGQGAEPRIAPADAFARFCGGIEARPGSKRVAVVFDFGDPADAPAGQSPPASRGSCARVPLASTGSQVLAEVADVRAEGGLVCAIAGYPRGECAPAVAQATRSAAAPAAPQQSRTPASPTLRGEDPAPRTARPSPAAEPASRPSADGGTPQQRQSPAASPAPTGSEDAGAATGPRPQRKPAGERPSASPATTDVPSPAVGESAAPATPAGSAVPQFSAAEAKSDPAPAAGPWPLVALAALLALGGWAVRRARLRR